MDFNKKFVYSKDKKIGEGTYAVVYSGHYTPPESENPIKIAIKKIKLGQFKDGLDLSAIREVKSLQELKHTNIVNVSNFVF